MARRNSKRRLFSDMSYRDVQRSNTNRKKNLSKSDQAWLKANGYKNVGWDHVIKLYQKINDILASADQDDLTLEELFLQADRIGEKYQTLEERAAFDHALRVEVESIANLIEQQFPDTELEAVDYSKKSSPTAKQKIRKNRKK
jgi:hypothetical protein